MMHERHDQFRVDCAGLYDNTVRGGGRSKTSKAPDGVRGFLSPFGADGFRAVRLEVTKRGRKSCADIGQLSSQQTNKFGADQKSVRVRQPNPYIATKSL